MSGGEEGVVSGADGDGNYSSRIQAELLGLASRTNRSNVLINLGASIVVPAVFWDAVEHRSFLLWWGLAVIVWSIFRMTTSIVFRRRQRRDEIEPGSLPFWTSVYGVGVIGAALLWSTATVYLLPSAQLEQTFIILLIVASLAVARPARSHRSRRSARSTSPCSCSPASPSWPLRRSHIFC